MDENIPEIDADIVIYGDVHFQFAKRQKEQLIINTGSVGNSLENEYTERKRPVYADYLILNEDLAYEFVKLKYNVEQEIEFAKNSGMPHVEKYISELRTGRTFKL